MAEIIAIVPTGGLLSIIAGLANLVTGPYVSYFKYGEGGWINPGGGRERRDPLDLTHGAYAFTDLDAVEDLARGVPRYAADERTVFQKSVGPAGISVIGGSQIRVRCLLDFGDFNDDGYGNDPELWEVGLFDQYDNLLAYGTFPLQTKNITKQLENFVNIIGTQTP